jgi:DNA-binding LacI/PurR family transcriptional regulator
MWRSQDRADNPVTIKDVASHARVSIATVSAVLTANKYVSPELSERVRASIAELGYVRNSMAQGLKQRTSYAIGVIVSDICNPLFTTIVRGIEDVTRARGYSLILGNSDEDVVKERQYLDLAQRKRVDGFIVAATAESRANLASWPRHQIPLVTIDRSLIDLGFDTVLVDNLLGAGQAVEHLIALGHRRIGLVIGQRGISGTDERLAGYERALAAHGIAVDPSLIVQGHYQREGGRRAVQDLLMRGAGRPTAVFITNGHMMIGGLEATAAIGLRCPEDIALVGFDDPEWAAVLSPRLTTVIQPAYEMGKRAADLLFERLQGSDAPPREIRLRPQLIVRDSCGAALQPHALATD